MNELDNYETLFQQISDSDFIHAQENLMKNMKQKSFYREKQFVVYENETISSNFAGENLRRSYYMNSEFDRADLTNVGFSGSIFVSTDFYDCIINNTKLDFCELDDCEFNNTLKTELLHLNLNESIVSNGRFLNLNLHAANFTNTIFENVLFKDCIWKSSCLEGTVFKNSTLDNVKLQKLNFEFSRFDNIKMNNIRLPFPTIPYIFNGISYLMHTSDSITISSAASENGAISIDEYLSYLEDLIIFYEKTQNYFPLANILIAKEKYEQAYVAILSGIKFSMMHIRNFRLVYYYSKLLQITPAFTATQKTHVYNSIINFSGLINWRPIDYYNFNHYIDKIRNTLLNEKDSNFITVTLSTNISSIEYKKLSCLYQVIDNVFQLIEKEKNKKITYYTEIRHNSPYEIFIKAFSNPDMLSLLLDAISLVCLGIGKIISGKKEKESEQREKEKLFVLKNIEEDLKSEQLNYLKLQNEQLILQNTILRQQLDNLNSNINKNGIVINNINHYMSNTNM